MFEARGVGRSGVHCLFGCSKKATAWTAETHAAALPMPLVTFQGVDGTDTKMAQTPSTCKPPKLGDRCPLGSSIHFRVILELAPQENTLDQTCGC